jgi:4-amino-4-deoxy-L-arabinose transferase-like glycosyltransferase
MIARNLYRGRSTLLRPVVDDLGSPGYFVKEIPLVPAATALIYTATGHVDESRGRLVSVLAWLCGVPLALALLRRSGSEAEALVVGGWWIGAPLAFVYARAFMSDAAMVSASVAFLLALVRWREAPAGGRPAMTAALLALALLLKPHAIFWLAPASLVVLASRADGAARPARRALAILIVAVACAGTLAAAWYLHAASVHRVFPAAGTTRLDGWFDAPSLLSPALYGELLRQLLWMIFTPVGVLLAVLGTFSRRLGWRAVERALLAWGAGVLVQCLVFDTRLFDDYARGTEYYQLAMVPVAGMLIGRGIRAVHDALPESRRALRAPLLAIILVLLMAGAVLEIRDALALPERYQRILSDCALVRTLTQPRDEIFVLADRGGTILYYCDRRGSTFVPARAVQKVFARADNVAGAKQLADALDRASYVYIPFPELLGAGSSWLAMFERDWARVATPGTEARLYRRGPASSG